MSLTDKGLDANVGLLAKQTNPKGRDKVKVKKGSGDQLIDRTKPSELKNLNT